MAFSYKASISIDHTKVPNTDQSNFPVLVSGTYAGAAGVPDLRSAGNGGHVQNSNGYDLQFFSDSALTTRLPAERETYNAATGEINYWVKVPTVATAADTTIYIAYGDSGISTDPNSDGTYGATSTWDTNYKGVWHLPDGTTLSYNDSTGNNNAAAGTAAPTATTGQVDGGMALNGTSQYATVGTISSGNVLMLNGSAATFEVWVNPTGQQSNARMIDKSAGANGLGGYAFYLNAGGGTSEQITIGISGSGVAVATPSMDGAWHHLVWVHPTSGPELVYVDGTQAGTNSNLGAVPNSNQLLYFGNASFATRLLKGSMDEVRISNATRSADWVKTGYNSQNSPSTFYTMGSETAVGGGTTTSTTITTSSSTTTTSSSSSTSSSTTTTSSSTTSTLSTSSSTTTTSSSTSTSSSTTTTSSSTSSSTTTTSSSTSTSSSTTTTSSSTSTTITGTTTSTSTTLTTSSSTTTTSSSSSSSTSSSTTTTSSSTTSTLSTSSSTTTTSSSTTTTLSTSSSTTTTSSSTSSSSSTTTTSSSTTSTLSTSSSTTTTSSSTTTTSSSTTQTTTTGTTSTSTSTTVTIFVPPNGGIPVQTRWLEKQLKTHFDIGIWHEKNRLNKIFRDGVSKPSFFKKPKPLKVDGTFVPKFKNLTSTKPGRGDKK